jgi:glycosyltransferase involved in cell wall biosynthesis
VLLDDAPPHVTFVITSLGIGGAEAQLTYLARALVAAGWPLRVIALRDGAGLREELQADGIDVQALTPRGRRPGPGVVGALAREIDRYPGTCLVTFLLQANVVGRLAGSLRRVPVVSSIRNSRFGGNSALGARVGDLLERSTAGLAHTVVINSTETARALVARGVVPVAKVRVIPNALLPRVSEPSGNDRAQARSALGLEHDAFVWITVGRLQPQKNHAALLEAFADVRMHRPGSILLVVGEGQLAPMLATQAKALGIGDDVRFLGLRRDVPRLLALSDAFVLASRWEGLPNVVMESLDAGLPTVSTQVGGVDALIEDRVSGWLAASSEPVEIARAMIRLLDCPVDERARIATTGCARVRQGFGLEPVVEAWKAVILDACRQRRPPRS